MIVYLTIVLVFFCWGFCLLACIYKTQHISLFDQIFACLESRRNERQIKIKQKESLLMIKLPAMIEVKRREEEQKTKRRRQQQKKSLRQEAEVLHDRLP